uniref:Uncharacterized protein n=1 Tax=Arundo donax TaxID=35708 RepID=A0A0A9FUP9_ARUDO
MLLAASPSTAITMCGSSLTAELSASPPSSCSTSMTRLLDGLLMHSHLKKLPDLYALDWREGGSS